MMARILRLTAGLLLVVGLVLGFSIISLQSAGAASPKAAACAGAGGTWKETDPATGVGTCTTPGAKSVPSVLQRVIDILIFIVGSVSVLMVIVGGIRYALAQGDQQAISAAKNTVLYALVGVAVAVLGYAIVNFVTIQLLK